LQGGDLREKLDTLYTARDPIYTELADYIIDTGKQSANEITQQIDTLIKQTLLDSNT
jgi:shikimate kinase